MFFLLSALGPLSGPQARQKLFGRAGKGAAWDRSTAFVEITVEGAGCSQAAFGCRPEPAAYLIDFLLIQVTSAPAS
jgi:hypothetical protein